VKEKESREDWYLVSTRQKLPGNRKKRHILQADDYNIVQNFSLIF